MYTVHKKHAPACYLAVVGSKFRVQVGKPLTAVQGRVYVVFNLFSSYFKGFDEEDVQFSPSTNRETAFVDA